MVSTAALLKSEVKSEETVPPSLTPPLKWAGGKRWLVPKLQEIFSSYRAHRLVEPFAGGLSVALGLQPTRALLSDINPHVINFYTWLQRGLVIDFEMKNDSECFYAARARFNSLIQDGDAASKEKSKEAASLFYYLNRTCFNGLCRFNNKGEFNVPFGQYKTINYTRDFLHYQPVLSSWQFFTSDFESLNIGSNDFLYVDPPYDVEFTKYAAEDFTWDDQVRLAKWLANLDCPIVVSNQATERVISLYGELGFNIEFVAGPRRISSNGVRGNETELLGTKNLRK